MILNDCANVLRSKNAGPFYLALDVFFQNRALFDAIKAYGLLSAERVAEVYRVDVVDVRGPFWVESPLGCKITVPKIPTSSDIRCADMMGAHQHIPLATMPVPDSLRDLLDTPAR